MVKGEDNCCVEFVWFKFHRYKSKHVTLFQKNQTISPHLNKYIFIIWRERASKMSTIPQITIIKSAMDIFKKKTIDISHNRCCSNIMMQESVLKGIIKNE